jgi:nucleotide sugar dehydrogenase
MTINVCVIGIGYVGEQLVNSFLNKDDFKVIGYDINEERLHILREKYVTCYFTNNENELKDVDLFCISVPTLLNKSKTNIENKPIMDVKKMLLNIAKRHSTIVLESTIFVGGTREIFGDFLKCEINVGFSPERVDSGRIEPSHSDIPKIVSGLNEDSCNIIMKYYSKIFSKLVPVSSTECAEMCKLYENCFRLINIAYTNEMSDLCDYFKINPYEMINACSTKPFGFMPFYPGLGIGGHCIPVNPYYIAKGNFKNLPCLEISLKKSEERPYKKAEQILSENKNINSILIIGAAFKPGESIITNSPSIDLAKALSQSGKKICIYDPLVVNKYNVDTNCNYVNSILNPFCSKHGEISWISDAEFTADNILNKMDVIIVCMKQYNINWDILCKVEKLGKKVYWFCNKDAIFNP